MMHLIHSDTDQKALESLFSQAMTRKQFLLYVGVAIVGMLGIKNFTNAFLHQPTKRQSVPINGAYGGGNYSSRSAKSLSGGKP
jgi:hypothetical protein